MSRFFSWVEDEGPKIDATRELLFPRFDDLAKLFHGSWNEWMDHIKDTTRAKIGPMARGIVIHDLAVSRAREVFPTEAAVKGKVVLCEEQFAKFIVDDEYVLRPKKVGPDHRVVVPHGPSGEQTRKYYWDSDMIVLARHWKRLTLGYVVNDVGTAIEDIVVTLQYQRSVIWSFSILDDAYTIDGAAEPKNPPKPPKIETSGDERKSTGV